MNTAALPRNPSRVAPAGNAVAKLLIMIFRRIAAARKTWKDRRALQTVPANLLADMGMERTEIRTTSGAYEVWIRPRRQ